MNAEPHVSKDYIALIPLLISLMCFLIFKTDLRKSGYKRTDDNEFDEQFDMSFAEPLTVSWYFSQAALLIAIGPHVFKTICLFFGLFL